MHPVPVQPALPGRRDGARQAAGCGCGASSSRGALVGGSGAPAPGPPGSAPPAAPSNSEAERRIPYRRCTACLVTPSADPTESQENPSARSNSTAAATSVSTLSRSSWASRTVGAGARP